MEISPVGCVRGLKCSVGLCQLHSAAERSFRSSPSSGKEKKNQKQSSDFWSLKQCVLRPVIADHRGSCLCEQQKTCCLLCWVLKCVAWRNSSYLSNQCSKLNQAMMMLGVNLNFLLQHSLFGISVKHCSHN